MLETPGLERRHARASACAARDEPVIEYRERSPLVVPPSRDLPPPQANAAARESGLAGRSRRQARARIGPTPRSSKADRSAPRANRQAGQRRSTPDRAQSARVAPAPPAGICAASRPTDAGRTARLLPSELGYFGGLFSWRGFGFGRQQGRSRDLHRRAAAHDADRAAARLSDAVAGAALRRDASAIGAGRGRSSTIPPG